MRRATSPTVPPELAAVTEDEIWVIAPSRRRRHRGRSTRRRRGRGRCWHGSRRRRCRCRSSTRMSKGRSAGYIATVEVMQQFQNPFSEKIEAVYVFPLPQNAAVNEFIMTIGERRIRGIIRERQEAEQIYQRGQPPGLRRVAADPGAAEHLHADGRQHRAGQADRRQHQVLQHARLRGRLVRVQLPDGRRPALQPAGQHGRRRRGRPGQGGPLRPSTEVQYLKPSERSGHDIALALDLDAGVEIEEIACSSHAIKKSRSGAEKAHVQLSPLDSIPNKDFVLRYKVAGETIKSALLIQRDEHARVADVPSARRRSPRHGWLLHPDALSAGGPAARPACPDGDGLRPRLLRQHERPAHRQGQGGRPARPAQRSGRTTRSRSFASRSAPRSSARTPCPRRRRTCSGPSPTSMRCRARAAR